MAKVVKRASETAAGKKRAAAKAKAVKMIKCVARKPLYIGGGQFVRPGDHFAINENKAKYLIGLGDAMTPAQEAAGMEVEKDKASGKDAEYAALAEELEEYAEDEKPAAKSGSSASA